MSTLLTELDIKMLQVLREIGPSNISKVARNIGISRKALMLRIKRMWSDPKFFLRMYISVYHTNLGLKKCVVFSEAKPGMENLLFDCLKVNDFWLYVCRSYGVGEGCTAVYAIPIEHCKEFENFAREIRRLGVAKNVKVYWSTCFQGGRITSEWFDASQERWVFRWDDWVKEIQAQTIDLPYTLIEAKEYHNYADEIDLKILEKLEANATRSLSMVAKSLGISRQLVQYHYDNHIVAKNLLEGYEVFVMRYSDPSYVMAYFVINFHGYEDFAKFTRSLLNKSFVITMGKVYGENGLIVEVFLPIEEFRKFIDTLSAMVRMKLISDYKYAIQDLRIRCRQTIWPQFFDGNSWVYNHGDYMEKLRQKVKSESFQGESELGKVITA
jgi:DNA-binding Lrp family transcriptional regulator